MHAASEAVDGTPEATLVFDADGTVVYSDLDGSDGVVGGAVSSLFAPGDADALDDLVGRVLDGEPATVEAEFEADGESRRVVVRARPGSFDGGAAGHIGLHAGTPRRRTAAALERLNELSADESLSFADKVERLLEVGCEHYDLDVGFLSSISDEFDVLDATGNHERLQPGTSAPLSETYCQRTLESEDALAVEDAAESPDIPDHAHEAYGLGCYVGARVVVDGETYGTLCFADDEPRERPFTELDRAFLQLAARWVGYEIENRLRERELTERRRRFEEFAGLLGHDLRNPLSVAVARLDYVRGQVDDDQVDPDHFEAIEEGLDRIDGLIDDMLRFARLGEQVSDATEVPLSAAAEEAWTAVGTRDAELVVTDEAEAVQADRSRLLALFENLFSNAVDHGGPAVTVTVGATDEGFYVADDGPGIPADERDKVFEMGHTSDDDGTGFGLATVSRIASAHGWTVGATASESGGARFEFDIEPAPI
ncbi:ATP-binding protein [Halorarius halobius]|uniref:ATP-binding protein n=1 Tax=Halorarius halobius TaxID=2962671 RepID=UPI0020CF27F8|nr:ATP-binding protein [Halorarius halobius]